MAAAPTVSKLLDRLDRLGRGLENLVLVSLLTGMILLATTQIVLRNFFNTGLMMADGLLNLTVLWLAMFGAVAASRDGRHINIDVLSRFLPEPLLHFSRVLLYLFTLFVAATIGWYGGQFVAESREYGDTVLGGAPAWYFQLALPAGFGLIAYRYAVLVVRELLKLIPGRR